MTNNLCRHFGGVSLRTPPDSIRDLRQSFDTFPELIRRAYYAVGNYVAEKQVIEVCNEKPVIMDRQSNDMWMRTRWRLEMTATDKEKEGLVQFWLSTTAYTIAKECGIGTGEYFPPKGHPVYQWPADLLCPTAVIFLTVAENERDYRLQIRAEGTTVEEKQLSASEMFRKRLIVNERKQFATGETQMIAFTRPHISLQLPTYDEIDFRRRLYDLIVTKLRHKPVNALWDLKS